MSANNASTGNSYLEKATGYAQSALGTVTGSSADKVSTVRHNSPAIPIW